MAPVTKKTVKRRTSTQQSVSSPAVSHAMSGRPSTSDQDIPAEVPEPSVEQVVLPAELEQAVYIPESDPKYVTYDNRVHEFQSKQMKFRKACKQVVLLNNRITEVQERYDRAARDGRKAFRYVLRLNLATYEGVRNMMYEYACGMADELDLLQDRLAELGQLEEAWEGLQMD